MIEEKIGKILVFIAILFSLIIIISNIVGFFWLDSGAILIVSFIGALLLSKFIPKISVDKKVFGLIILLTIMLAYPVVFITPGFTAGADAVSTTMVRVLEGTIPLDHAQYGGLNLSYQLGFPLIANVFVEVAPIMPDYLWPWALVVLAGALQLFFVYLFSGEFFKSEKAAFISTVLFFGGKLVYENVYNGEFAWVMATSFMFLFLYLFLKKNKLQYIVFPVVFVTHPAVGFNLLVFMGVYLAFYKIKIKELLKLLASLILVIPLIIMSYFPLIYNILFNKTSMSEGVGLSIFKDLLALPPWIGTALSIVFILLLIYSILKKNFLKEKEQKFLFTFLIVSLAIFILFDFIGFMLAGRVVELILIAMLLLGTSLLTKLKLDKKKLSIILVIILVMSLFFFATSSRLDHYRNSTKNNLENIAFAAAFFEFDPSQEKVLFLSQGGGGKIGEYSNKIPFNLESAHMILLRDFSYYPSDSFDEFKNNILIWDEIFFENKIELIDEIDVKYIVVNKENFETKLNYPIVFEHSKFIVYEKN
jgi:hypothetical protein